MIRVKNLSKLFHTEEVGTIVLSDVSFRVESKEFVAIMGLSGRGKLTLPNILELLDNPTGDEYWLGDKEVSALKKKDRIDVRKGETGLVFQSFNLTDRLNVEENVELPPTYLDMLKAERRQKVRDVMKRMGISRRVKHFPHQPSGDQQQRMTIARAVVFGPELILADESADNLDSKNGTEMMSLLIELSREGTTIVIVTHDEHDASIAHRIMQLFDGQIVG